MPFTLSHAIAAAPLQRLLGRHAVLSALVIGCWTPDLPYFLPLGLSRGVSHSEIGLFYYALPVGCLVYLLYHHFMKAPLAALLPTRVLERLTIEQGAPPVHQWKVATSVWLGAASHLLWDAFTHGDAAGVRWVPALQHVIFTVGRYPVFGFALAQHLSTVLGLGLLMLWSRQALKNRSARHLPITSALSFGERTLAVSMIIAVAATTAITQGLYAAAIAENAHAAHQHLGVAAIAGLQAFGVSVLGYCALWQWRQARLPALRDVSRRVRPWGRSRCK
jgi:Domain of unknown function (DUF4184)